MGTEAYSRRANKLIERADEAIKKNWHDSFGHHYVDPGSIAGLRAAGLSLLANAFGESHALYRTFEAKTKGTTLGDAQAAREILMMAKEELEGDWFSSVRGIVAAEVFADFLEMSDHFLSEGYKDAAAVLVGGVLEEHLRQLAARAGVGTTVPRDGRELPKRAELLNADLVKAGVYGKLDQQLVTSMLALRNRAAHARYDEYELSQVTLMHQSVSDFVARTNR